MRRERRLIIVLAAILILTMSGIGVTAKEQKSEAVSKHTHSYIISNYITAYASANDSQHTKYVTPVFTCQICGSSYQGNRVASTESHSYSGWSWTGQNYHAGTQHYFQYARTCTVCNHSQQEWRHQDCPGGNCPMPSAVIIEIEK
ncbi:MAG: hypothetical protein UFG06_01175 [Lachnospiraceae bacterium]|nr:hypothetical protein [Lachnospiraceae bacterium]